METPLTISEALVSAANWHANAAFKSWDSGDFNERLHAAISVGVAAELLLKYFLAKQSPALLAELTAKDQKKALNARIKFAEDRYRASLAEVHSCSAEEARFIHETSDLIPTLVGRDEFAQVMQVRNAAAHLAVLSEQKSLKAAVFEVITMYEGAQAVDSKCNPFEDADLEAKMQLFAETYRLETYAEITKKIASHKKPDTSDAALQQRRRILTRDFLDEASYRAFGNQEEGWETFTRPERVAHKCKSCGAQGTLLCESEGEFFTDANGKDEHRNILSPMCFACENCGLCLSHSELRSMVKAEDAWAVNALHAIERPASFYEGLAQQRTRRDATPTPRDPSQPSPWVVNG